MSGSRYVKLKDIEEASTLECHEKALISSSSIISSPHTKYISSPLILPIMQTQAFGLGKFEYIESNSSIELTIWVTMGVVTLVPRGTGRLKHRIPSKSQWVSRKTPPSPSNKISILFLYHAHRFQI